MLKCDYLKACLLTNACTGVRIYSATEYVVKQTYAINQANSAMDRGTEHINILKPFSKI
jgi:hypothetical protein